MVVRPLFGVQPELEEMEIFKPLPYSYNWHKQEHVCGKDVAGDFYGSQNPS